MGAAGGACTGAEVHRVGLPNVQVNVPRARRQWVRMLFPHLKAYLSGLREIPEGM
ncbi:hypothetical protein [Methanoculleus sp.]|uniref:hypothetical protein n=1 Tax=Methanoculleus sp. TaxID=90427 RepID=UPI001BD306FE|nr:hypothetical protein [Methanoculleus sp.]